MKFVILMFLFCFIPLLAFCKQQEKSDAEIVLKSDAYIFVPVIVIGFSQWNWGDPKFRKGNEKFFQETSRYGGVDKIGHFYSSYLISDLLSKKFVADGIEMERASLYGAGSSFALATLIEIGDATSKKYGFSYEDQVMNTLGALASYVLLNSPSLNKKIDFKIDYIPTSNPLGMDDYEGMRFLASLKLSGFDFARNNFWRFIEIQTNYSAPGYADRKINKSREWGDY